jgi:hypothetical protein
MHYLSENLTDHEAETQILTKQRTIGKEFYCEGVRACVYVCV